MPESAWKLVFYTMSWSYSTYLLFFTSYSFFHDPPSVFYSKTRTSNLLTIRGPASQLETPSGFSELILQVIMNQQFTGAIKTAPDAGLRKK